MSLTFNIKIFTAFRYDAETQVYVGFCPSLKIYAQGTNQERAERSLIDAVTLFVRSCFKRDILQKVLKERGFTDMGNTEMTPLAERMSECVQIKEKGFDWTKDVDIPISLLRRSNDQCPQSDQLALQS